MPMEWSEGKAIYLQIMEHISKEIAAGILKPGQRVKSVREYAAELEVNPNTVQRALHELEREGILTSSRNTGRYVTQDRTTIDAMRQSQAEAAVQAFCSKMKELGYTSQEAEAFFRKGIADAFAVESVKAG